MALKTQKRDGILRPISRPPTIADEVAEQVTMAIVHGEKKPGERVTEIELAGAMKISRIPAREALQKLAHQGVLVPAGGRGLKVADFSEERSDELFEVRLGLERISFRRAMARVQEQPELIAPVEQTIDQMRALASNDHSILLGQTDVAFHRAVVEISGNQLLQQVWESLAPNMLIVFCNDWFQTENRMNEVAIHEALKDLLLSGRPEDIDPMLQDHLIGVSMANRRKARNQN